MSRRKILGRASLSFPAVDGILDVDQILQTDPWKQIDDFVQQNFTQNILNEFNERLTLEPKLTPVDNTSPRKRRATPSGRSPRNSEASRTNEEKSPKKKLDDQPVGDGAKLNERKKEIAKKSGKAKVSTSKEQKQLEDVPNVTVEKSRATISDKRSGKCKNEEKERIVDDPTETKQQRETDNTDPMNDQMENTAKDTNSVNTSKSMNSKSPFRTSTPRRGKASKQDNLTGKGANATTEHDIPASDSSVRHNDSTNNCNEQQLAFVTKDLNNNNDSTAAKKNGSKGKKVRCKHKKEEKVRKEKKPGSKKTSDISMKTASRCKNHDQKMTTAETKQIGKEKHLLKQRRRRYKGKIRRIERKADRAMETYIHHVTRIIKKMGYLPEDSSCSENDDSYSDFSDESSYCSSYCSDSCCSYCSNGCYSSCDYSEYTLFSCSCSSSSSSFSSSSSSSSSSPARGLLFRSKTK